MILDAWKESPEHIKTVLIHMEKDFFEQYRNTLLNFKIGNKSLKKCMGGAHRVP